MNPQYTLKELGKVFCAGYQAFCEGLQTKEVPAPYCDDQIIAGAWANGYCDAAAVRALQITVH